jgi:thioredoxin reductase (NADPH)
MKALTAIQTEALVIGAGPVGLFQVFQLGLQGVRCHVVDALPEAGGQCQALYPDKPIYDIPGLPRCTGRELSERLVQQVRPFQPSWHWSQEVSELHRQPDGVWLLRTTAGQAFLAKAVFIAAGVGAFVPRALRVDGIAAFEGTSLLYRLPDPTVLAGQRVVVMGGDEPAVSAALQALSPPNGVAPPRSVCLLHRKDEFDANAELLNKLRDARASGRLKVAVGQPIGLQTHGPEASKRLNGLLLATADDTEHCLPLDRLVALLGLSPRLGPLAAWGLAMERKLLSVDPATFATSEPGIYAVGDINHYPGKRKLIVCGFHEATLAAFAAAAQLRPQEPVRLQYTTTSTLLHQRLGLSGP